MSFVSLHNHCWASNQRFLDSINKPEEMVEKAISLGFSGIAFTDHESLSAAVNILKIRDKIQKDHPDFKIIFGNEIYLIDESEIKNTQKYYHFILLAKDLVGWEQLRTLSSRAWERGYTEKGIMRVPTTYQDIEEIIGGNPGHVFASTACFTRGHQVQTLSGLKNIEDVRAGDQVLTHDGTYQTVLYPTSREYNGIGYNIQFRHNDLGITCTEHHKFLVAQTKHSGEHALGWKEACDLKVNDKTLDLMPTYTYSHITSVDISDIIESYQRTIPTCVKSRYHLNRTILLTPELMRLYGLWLGDGSVSGVASENNGRVALSFNENEFEQYYPIVTQGLSALGTFNPIVEYRPESHKYECVINSSELAYLLRYISDDGKADTKFIYPSLKHVSRELDSEILYGYLLADGYYRTRDVRHSGYHSDETVDATVSHKLYNDITELYYSAGFVPRSYSIREHEQSGVHHKKAFYHTVSCGPFSDLCNKSSLLTHAELMEYLEDRARQHAKGKIFICDGTKYVYKTVRNITATHLEERVYCLNVDHNHSFICNGIIVHNCLGGRLPTLILDHNVPEANEFAKWCINIFGKDNFCFELQPSDNEEQIIVNKTLIKFAKHYDVPYIITTDSHYLDKEDFAIHSAFLNSKQSSDRETEKFYRFTYMMSEDEMKDILRAGGLSDEEIETGLNSTYNISAAIETFDFRHGTIVPKIKIPDFTLKRSLYSYDGYPMIKKYYDSEDEQDRYLMYQIEQGIEAKKVTIDDTKLDRINTELDVLDYISQNINQNLSAYLNLTVNIVDIAWQVSLVGCGRGSACGFYINYLIGITQADPLVYNLPYWRFLNKERAELPDVDEDFQPEKTEDIIRLLREEYGEDNVLNCATFKTESLKSSILTSGRGMGYNNDDMQALAALVPSHRGQTYTLKECLEGDEEKGFEAVPGFKEKLDLYPGLFNAVKKIEGLPTNASIHASALYVFNNGYLAQNSLMRAPNKTKMTAFNMHDSDDMGALKMDVLRTDAQSKMAKCLDLLLKDGQIEWQGSLRETYNKYLHPDVLDYDNSKMWERAADGDIANLFQFETQVGAVCIKKARPVNVMQLAEINSIMRLQSDGGEQPIDRYVRFRNNPDAWDLEMMEEGLSLSEMEILKKYLSGSNGVSGSQEVLMRILMDENVCRFTLGEANAARKAIAKKQAQKLIQLKKDFYEKGSAIGARDIFLNYVWKYCIEPQLGYSFSLNHTLPYSIVAVQEMNLATRWNPLYWQCACLCVNAGNYVGDMGTDDEEESAPTEDENEIADDSQSQSLSDDEKKDRRVAPNYGKIAKAIADAQLSGVNIELPDINESQVDFIPDIKNNSILYSLQAINVVGPDLLNRILNNRPFSSVEDFVTKVAPTQAQMLGLIKAGCFDKLYDIPRTAIINKYLQWVADQVFPLKDKLTSVQLKKALELGLQLPDYAKEIRIFKYKRYLDAKQSDKANKRYVLTEEACIKFFHSFIEQDLNIAKDEYGYLPNNAIFIKMSAFKRVYDKMLESLMEYINAEEGRKAYQDLLKTDYINSIKDKYCVGSTSKWEMDTMCFYHGDHELKNMLNSAYNTHNFNDLPESPEGQKPCTIAGTITDINNARHTVSILTNYGIVDVKFYAGLYTQFNQKISVIDPDTKKKTVVDDSWFKRGNKLLIHGIRRENMFCCKQDRSAGYTRSVGLIEKVNYDGSLDIRYSRNKK